MVEVKPVFYVQWRGRKYGPFSSLETAAKALETVERIWKQAHTQCLPAVKE